MYPESMQESIKKVKKTRSERLKLVKSGKEIYAMMTEKERDVILNKFHPVQACYIGMQLGMRKSFKNEIKN